MTCTRINGAIVCETPDFKPGDLPPDGYLAWHEWAEVQSRKGPVVVETVVCTECEAKGVSK